MYKPVHAQLKVVALAQDKGGPSEGGFLNNRSFSYMDLYSCNEINGMCINNMYICLYYSENHLY